MTKNADPGYFVEETAIVDGGEIVDEPGAIDEVADGSLQRGAIKMKDHIDMSSTFSMYQLMRQEGRDITGDPQGALQGDLGSEVRSGRHARVILDAVLTKPGYRITMLDPSWMRMARQYISNVLQFSDLNKEELGRQRDRFELRSFTMHDIMVALRNLDYHISIDSKEDLPHTLEGRIAIYRSLYLDGIIPSSEYVHQINIPLREQTRTAIEEQSNPDEFRVGVPPQLRAEQQVANEQAINNLTR